MSPEANRYAINLAKAEIREGYATADPERILAHYADRFSDLSHAMPSFGGAEAGQVLRARLAALFARHPVRLVWLTIEIALLGHTAIDHGWRELHTETAILRTRYLQIWKKDATGVWRIALFIDNPDVPSAFAADLIADLIPRTTPPTDA